MACAVSPCRIRWPWRWYRTKSTDPLARCNSQSKVCLFVDYFPAHIGVEVEISLRFSIGGLEKLEKFNLSDTTPSQKYVCLIFLFRLCGGQISNLWIDFVPSKNKLREIISRIECGSWYPHNRQHLSCSAAFVSLLSEINYTIPVPRIARNSKNI